MDLGGVGSIGLYPNPSGGEFFIELDGEPADLMLLIFDSRGRLLKQTTYEQVNRLQEDLYAYPGGIYQIQIISGEMTRHLKFLKQ